MKAKEKRGRVPGSIISKIAGEALNPQGALVQILECGHPVDLPHRSIFMQARLCPLCTNGFWPNKSLARWIAAREELTDSIVFRQEGSVMRVTASGETHTALLAVKRRPPPTHGVGLN